MSGPAFRESTQLRELRGEFERDPALARRAEQALGAIGEPEPEQALLAFPKAAWRGVFAAYRDVMRACSEASDVYHFTALWSALGNALGRRVWFPYSMRLYANTYLIAFGPTGDFKTSACRHGAGITESAGLRVSRGVGSGEGITDGLGEEPTLFFLEEFTSLLRQGRWEGSTLLSVFTEIFDCPERFERKYRKNPISLDRPVVLFWAELLVRGSGAMCGRWTLRADSATGFSISPGGPMNLCRVPRSQIWALQ